METPDSAVHCRLAVVADSTYARRLDGAEPRVVQIENARLTVKADRPDGLLEVWAAITGDPPSFDLVDTALRELGFDWESVRWSAPGLVGFVKAPRFPRLSKWLNRNFPGPKRRIPKTMIRAFTAEPLLTVELAIAIIAGGWWAISNVQVPDIVVILVGLLVWLVVAVLLALRQLDVDKWASVQIEGRRPHEIFHAVADLAEATLLEFLTVTKDDTRLLQATEFARNQHDSVPPQGAPAAYRRAWEDFAQQGDGLKGQLTAKVQRKHRPHVVEKLLIRQRRQLRQLEELKTLGARELGVSKRRFCDHIVHFSPELYVELVRKYGENFREIRGGIGQAEAQDIPRIVGLIRENHDLRWNASWRALLQSRLRAFAGLADVITGLAAARSTSGAVLRYADALTAASKFAESSEDWSALDFVYSKRRAHAGVDIHALLERLFKLSMNMPQPDPHRQSSFTILDHMLKTMTVRNMIGRLESRDWESGELLGAIPKDEAPRIRFYVGRYFSRSLDRIADEFDDTIADWRTAIEDRGGTVHIVTHGFSRTVREVLTRETDARRARALDWPIGNLYILTRPDTHSLDARLMQYQLKRKRRIKALPGRGAPLMSHQIIAAGADFVFGAVSPMDGILVIIGAEAWSDDCRILHPRGLGDIATRIRQEKTGKGEGFGLPDETDVEVAVVAVAEGYKRTERIATSAEFYEGADDHIELLGPPVMNTIVSDVTWRGAGPLPADFGDKATSPDDPYSTRYDIDP